MSKTPPFLTLALTLNSVDDCDYQRAFAALDELNLTSLKQFFKENYLQVFKTIYKNSFFKCLLHLKGKSLYSSIV